MDSFLSLTHGGQLLAISKAFNRPLSEWIDLSTGVSPIPYPVSNFDYSLLEKLPQETAEFRCSVERYYHSSHFITTNGSQQLISLLPVFNRLRCKHSLKVWVPLVGYKEHEKSWAIHGYEITHYNDLSDLQHISSSDVVVAINPNNPNGELFSIDQLNVLLKTIIEKNGLLVIDEAFMDVFPNSFSCIRLVCDNLIVLRSLGKFFGLPGLRVGFAFSSKENIQTIGHLVGPWSYNSLGLSLTEKCLSDTEWQQNSLNSLSHLTKCLDEVLSKYFSSDIQGCTLFRTVKLENATHIHRKLLMCGIYSRLCDEKNAIRFGIANNEQLEQLSVRLAKKFSHSTQTYLTI